MEAKIKMGLFEAKNLADARRKARRAVKIFNNRGLNLPKRKLGKVEKTGRKGIYHFYTKEK